MSIAHALPRLFVRNSGAPEAKKTKLPKIPTMGGKSNVKIPDQTIGEIRWLSEHGWPHARIAKHFSLSRNYVYSVVEGCARPTIDAIRPEWV